MIVSHLKGNKNGNEVATDWQHFGHVEVAHPALAPEARVALTLREVCGLTTEEIARAFLVAAPTLAQRIVRAKARIREARIPYEVPAPAQLILLDQQDRSLWNREQIAEGVTLVERALKSRRFGPYTLQAAIAAAHSEADRAEATDWPQIVALYSVLARADPSPVVELNRAVAVAMRDGPEAGLRLIDALLSRGQLADYHLAHSARAELFRRLGKTTETKEQIGGILILEARDLNHAVQLMSKHPGVKAGPFEIRPAADLTQMIRDSEQRRGKA